MVDVIEISFDVDVDKPFYPCPGSIKWAKGGVT
jgi:hypothetical protein